MRIILATTIALLFTSCAAPDWRTQASLMDEVEKRVQLPNGAYQLDDYARYYILRDGMISGRYIIPPKSGPDSLSLTAGQRQWVDPDPADGDSDGYGDIPDIDGRGCAIVDVSFNTATHKVEEASCTGDI